MGWTRKVPQLGPWWDMVQHYQNATRVEIKSDCWWCGQCPGRDPSCVACGDDNGEPKR
jgi:hypothetical protein